MQKIHIAKLLVALQVISLVGQVGASESTASLIEKVRISDVVAIVKITDVEKGRFHVPEGGYEAMLEIKMQVELVDRIKGNPPDAIVVTAYSSSYVFLDEIGKMIRVMSTAGFSDYKLEPHKSYIAYLKEDRDGEYRLGRDSNQFLEEIGADGMMVRDIGQTTEQVPLRPKLWKLRALALATHYATISFAGLVILLGVIWSIRRIRIRCRQ